MSFYGGVTNQLQNDNRRLRARGNASRQLGTERPRAAQGQLEAPTELLACPSCSEPFGKAKRALDAAS